MRWHPHNAAAHCFSCHQRLGGNPIDFADWIRAYLVRFYGDAAANDLPAMSRRVVRWRKKDLEELYEEMKCELASVVSERKLGKEGRIDFWLKKVEEMLGEF